MKLQDVLKLIDAAASKMQVGFIIVTVQDGRLIQMEKSEKMRLPAVSLRELSADKESIAVSVLAQRVAGALRELAYGQVTLVVRDGEVIQIDRTEKLRIDRLQGLNGEGI
ncbi:MAG: YezD family protein [Negativicutes bacterium]|nr:YezD family protein [Negativicutes bacterium]